VAKLIKSLTILFIFAGTTHGQENKNPSSAADIISQLDNFVNVDYLGDSVIVSLPRARGKYCMNWVKLSDTLPAAQRNPDAPKDWRMYRSVICQVSNGRCPEARECAVDTIKTPYYDKELKRDLIQYYDFKPNYAPLKKDQLKYVENWKGGRTVEFNNDAPFEDRKKPYVYDPDKHAALYENFPPPKGDYAFCTMPVKVTGDNTDPDRIPDTIACSAISIGGKNTCPDVPTCVRKRLSWTLPVAKVSTEKPATELALDPEGGRNSKDGEKAAPSKTHLY